MKCSICEGDALVLLKAMVAESVHCCVTSPPYWGLRNYQVKEQIGLEKTPEEYVEKIVKIFRGVRRVLRDDGTVWLNLGDSYTSGNRPDRDHSLVSKSSGLTNRSAGMDRPKTPPGLKPKDLVGIPWRVAFALQTDGWYLRSDIIWHKPNPMPESVTDRPTKSHEYIFLLSKNQKYYYDAEAIREDNHDSYNAKRGAIKHRFKTQSAMNTQTSTKEEMTEYATQGRNKRSTWTVPTAPYSGAHFAVFPPDLITPCILAGCPKGGTVLDPFAGSGTTGEVAEKLGRNSILIELNPEYIKLIKKRTAQQSMI